MKNKTKMQVVCRTISELKHPDYNPRQIKKTEFEQLKKSLDKFDSVEPAVINMFKGRENIIIGGNQRIRAAQALGWKEFPCVIVSLSEDRERELNIRLNANTGRWDYDILANNFEIDTLEDYGLCLDKIINESDRQIKKENIKAYKKHHILISFPVEKISDNKLFNLIKQIEEISGIECEKSFN